MADDMLGNFLTPTADDLRTLPACVVDFDAPATVESLPGASDVFFRVGLRKRGDPANLRFRGSGWAPGTAEVLNVHESGFLDRNSVEIDSDGRFLFRDETPIPDHWPLGKWQIQLTAKALDGTVMTEVCAKMELSAAAGSAGGNGNGDGAGDGDGDGAGDGDGDGAGDILAAGLFGLSRAMIVPVVSGLVAVAVGWFSRKG